MISEKTVFFWGKGVLAIIAIIAIIILTLWAIGFFKPSSPASPAEEGGRRLVNTYTLSPNDTWTYWDNAGSQTRGADNQQLVRDLFATQNNKQEVEFGTNRVLIFLLPGRYENLHIQVGYYTSVVGLGESAADTVVQGTIEIPNNNDSCIGALDNNFRNISNLTIEVDTTTLYSDDVADPRAEVVANQTIRQRHTNYFRVSQASPIRNIVVKSEGTRQANFAVAQFNGGCTGALDSGGYSSGGFMSNVLLVDGEMRFATQQQFFSRNCQYNIRSATAGGGGAWNIYLLGCVGKTGETPLGRKIMVTEVNKCPPNSSGGDLETQPPPLITLKEETPGLMASIPQIRYGLRPAGGRDIDAATFSIVKPGLVNNSSGLLPVDGEKLSNIFIVDATTSIKTINTKLAEGVNLIFSPLVYHFDEPVRITQSETVVLTLGYATIIPTAGSPAIIIAGDTEGVRLSGFVLQAGKIKSKALLLVGERPRGGGSETNPNIIYDIFARVGGGAD